jgi:threonine synthase
MGNWRGVIEEFRQFLPITEKTPIITLGEGNTPLVFAPKLAEEIGFNGRLYLKLEGMNPSGSFKDRGMAVAIAKAVEEGADVVICASTGNTLASAAAYSAAAGLKCIGLLPHGNVAKGKLSQGAMYGAIIVQVRSSFDAAQSIMKEIVKKYGITAVNSINPYRLQGQKTAAFEIWQELHKAPDYHFIPVGNAGNITAYWMGYKEWQAYSRENVPKMMGYQAEGASPIVLGRVVENPDTIASAIRVGNPARWQDALMVVKESGGKIDAVSDGNILIAYKMIPKLTGIFCEPASAASVAGLAQAVRNKEIENTEDTVAVCVLTGHGLKDADSAQKIMKKPVVLDADLEAVTKFLKL